MANANQVIVNGETILDLRSDTVTPETLQKGYTAHDKSGTKITGTLEASSLQSKSVTYTSNGTNIITPDKGYDGLSSVDVTVDVSGGGSGGEISINVENYSLAAVTLRRLGGNSQTIKSGGFATVDKLSNGSTICIEKAISNSPIMFFLEHGYISDGEFLTEEYRNEIMTAAEKFMKYRVGEICDSYGYERPYNIDICFDENSGVPAIVIY